MAPAHVCLNAARPLRFWWATPTLLQTHHALGRRGAPPISFVADHIAEKVLVRAIPIAPAGSFSRVSDLGCRAPSPNQMSNARSRNHQPLSGFHRPKIVPSGSAIQAK